jgi:hypothetical protein
MDSRAISTLVAALKKLADEYAADVSSLDLRDSILRLTELQDLLRELALETGRSSGLSRSSARNRIKAYFELYPNTVLSGKEVATVSGISEYARRIRELRDDYGMSILAGPSTAPGTGVGLQPDEYLYLRHP